MSPGDARRFAEEPAKRAVQALATRNFAMLAELADAARGLCLRPAKGARCRHMSVEELRGCAESTQVERWEVDDGADQGPLYACARAFERIFYARAFRQPTAVRYNCFPELGRGNNAATVIVAPAERAYVEYFAEETPPAGAQGFPRPWRSLWLVFDGQPDTPRLVELMAEYGGP